MTLAKRLLDLTIEYRDAVENQAHWGIYGQSVGRTPDEIAQEYETTLRELLACMP